MRIEDIYSNCDCKHSKVVYSNAFGDGHVFRKFRKNQKIRQKQNTETQKQTAKAIDTIAKDTSLQDAMKSLDKLDKKDATDKKGMSATSKALIGLAIAGVLIGGYLYYKKKHKK